MDTDKKHKNKQTAQNSIAVSLVNSISSEKKSASSDLLNAGKVGHGYITNIRMGHVATSDSFAYARFQPTTGAVYPITPVGDKTKIKKPVFSDSILLSPNSGHPCGLGGIVAYTPQGKTQLTTDLVIGEVFTPTKHTQHQIIRLCHQDEKQQKSKTENDLRLVEFKKQFKAEESTSTSTLTKKSELSPPEFRGGTTLLTADDVKYRSSKIKSTGGHRSLFSQPSHVMNDESAKEAATELGLCRGKFLKWDWGHLLPAGGSAKGIEVNLDPYNFVAVPATLNTWQMVPEMMARHLAQLGFVVEYTAAARTEQTKSGEFSFVAKEIYSSVKLQHHGLIAEFFTTREEHTKPLITDAVHMLSEFYKVAEKPVPKDLKEKFEKELEEKLAEMKKTFPPESFISPVKTVPVKQLPHVENNKVLIFSPTLVRKGFNDVKNKKASPKFTKQKPKPKPKANPKQKIQQKRSLPNNLDNSQIEESIAKRTRSNFQM